MSIPQVGDIGTKIRYDAGESIADKTVLKLEYRKPDGTTGEWTAVVYDTNSAEYETAAAGDLDVAGIWQLQIYIETPSWKGHSEIKKFEVAANLS